MVTDAQERDSRVRTLEWFIVLATILVANRFTWLCVFEIHKPLFSCEYGTTALELPIYLLIVALILVRIRKSPLRAAMAQAWRRNLVLIGFLVLCAASALWTVSLLLTLFRLVIVICCAVAASYFGVRYSDSQLLSFFVWFTCIVVSLSYLLVLFLPGAAIMSTIGLEGSWRGAFSHKNYAGAILAYGATNLALAFFVYRGKLARAAMVAFFLLTVIFIRFTESATGAILLAALLCVLAAALLWRQYKVALRRWHYILMGGTAALALGLIFLNFSRVLRLVGRSSTLTGRVPLWSYLLARLQGHGIWLGYGLWTVWRDAAFREQAGIAVHWPFQVIDGHSGYMDVLLFLGAVGLIWLLVLLVQTVWRALLRLRSGTKADSAWMLITAAYVILANTTISFIFQFETFHWVLLLTVLFAGTRALAAPGGNRETSSSSAT